MLLIQVDREQEFSAGWQFVGVWTVSAIKHSRSYTNNELYVRELLQLGQTLQAVGVADSSTNIMSPHLITEQDVILPWTLGCFLSNGFQELNAILLLCDIECKNLEKPAVSPCFLNIRMHKP